MKTKTPIGLLGLVGLIFTLALLTPALAQVTPTTGSTLTTTSPLAGSTTYNVNTAAVEVRKDRGLGVLYVLKPAGETNQVTLNFQLSNDGTNWAWATPHSVTLNLTTVGTNYVGFTNFSPATFNNARYWRLGPITAANTNAITNTISWSVHN